ncbi:MAG TPA: extracellular solute-binding protein [Anaerolineae bacterium]
MQVTIIAILESSSEERAIPYGMKITLVDCRAICRRLCLIITALAAVACTSAPPTPVPTATSSTPVTLRVFTYDAPPISQVLNLMTENFKKAHPEVVVKTVPIDSDPAQQLAGLMQSTDPPDIVWTIDAVTPSLIDAKLLLDMNELASIDRTFSAADINPAALAAGNGAGTSGLFMLPAVMESVQMFYNKDLFKAAGAPLPDANWTFDDLITACKRIQDKNMNMKCIGFSNQVMPDPSWWAYLVPWIKGYGGDVLSADGKLSTLSSPEALAGIQAYADLWLKSNVAAAPQQRGNCFEVARCAVVFSISGGISAMQHRIGNNFDWDVQFMPSHPKGRFTGTGTYGFGVFRETRRPQLAWDFIKQLATPELQQLIARQRLGMPVLKSVADDAALSNSNLPPANMQAFIKGSEFGLAPRAYPTACGNFYSGLVQSAISEAFKKVLDTTYKPAEAFKMADQAIQACLDKAK